MDWTNFRWNWTLKIRVQFRASSQRKITIAKMRIPLFHVDAFTKQPFRGNPAAVCPLPEWLDDELLLKVAAENNLSETAFFVPRVEHEVKHGVKHYDLRWFTPRCEVRLCGHATLASAHVILNLLQASLQTVRFETRLSGTLTVSKEGEKLSMDFPAMFAKPCTHLPEAVIEGLGSAPHPSNLLEANDTFIAVYETQATIRGICPDFARLAELHPFAVAVTAPGEESDFVSRYFAPSYGIPEDPVTGSAHCALTPYWTERLGKTHLYARQLSERGGELWCALAGERVAIKGNAVLTLQGTLQV